MLTHASALRNIFHSGVVPVSSPFAQWANLGIGPRSMRERVYFVVFSSCTPEQKEGMAAMMASMGLGSIEEARAVIERNEPLPVRESHFDGVSFPLRYII